MTFARVVGATGPQAMSGSTVFIFALLILLSPVAARQVCAQQQSQPPNAATGREAGFRLKSLDGKIYDTSEMRGDVLVVSFGAIWCTPCNWELVAIEELKEEYQGKPVKFLWISIDDEKRTSKYLLRQFAKDRGLTIPVLRDPKMEAFLQFSNTERIPVLVFFDRDGRFSGPSQRGMASEISDYKRLVRERVNTLLKTAEAQTTSAPASK